MEPEDWGKQFWFTFHTVAFYYPENPTDEEKESASNFYNSLKLLLPCDTCCEEYEKLINDNPVDEHLESPNDLSKWSYDIHNKVNARLGKKNDKTYEQIRAHYLKEEPIVPKPNPTIIRQPPPPQQRKQHNHQPNTNLRNGTPRNINLVTNFNASSANSYFSKNLNNRNSSYNRNNHSKYNEENQTKAPCKSCGKTRRRTRRP